MTTESLGRFNVVASYPDMKRARTAIDALEFSGVDSGKISLLGEGAREAEREANTRKNTTDRDAPMAKRLIGRAMFWGVVGAAIGALFGLILAAVGVNFASAGGQAAAWALLGSIVGSLWGAFSGVSQGEAWELTYAADDGEVNGQILVTVHSDDQKEIDRAEKILRDKEALTIGQFDADGNPRPHP